MFARFRSAFAGAAATAILAATSALGQIGPGEGQDVYIGIVEDDVKPIIVFVFSDPATPEYQPIARVAYYFDETYEQPAGEIFEAREACRFTFAFPEEIAEKYQRRPIYGPNSEVRFGENNDETALTVIDLPTYMARTAVATMFREGYLVNEQESAPFFNCAGFFWAQLLEQPPEVWEQLYGDLLNR